MQLTIDRSVFLKALSHGQSIVDRKTTINILSHVLLDASPEGLRLTTTDMDMALIETVPAVVIQPGSTTVSAQTLCDIVRKLPDGSTVELTLNQENGQLVVRAGRSRFNLSCLPAEDFPKLNHGDLPFRFTLSSSSLKRLLDRARFAMATEETRYYLNGIHFHTHVRDGQQYLRAVATDAHRLACIDMPMPEGADGMPGIIIGRKTVTEIRKLLGDNEDPVIVQLSDRRIEFVLPNAVLSARLIDGTYPDYEQAIPLHNDKTLIVESKIFASAVDRVATVTSDKLRVIKMNVSDNALMLSAATQEFGSASEEMAVDFPYEQSVEIGFNVLYLFDIAQQIPDDETEIRLCNGDAPAIIQSIADKDALYVLMPMRV